MDMPVRRARRINDLAAAIWRRLPTPAQESISAPVFSASTQPGRVDDEKVFAVLGTDVCEGVPCRSFEVEAVALSQHDCAIADLRVQLSLRHEDVFRDTAAMSDEL